MTTKHALIEEIPFHYLKKFVADTGVIRFGGPRSSRRDFVDGVASTLRKEECEFLYRSHHRRVSASDAAQSFNKNHRPNEEVVRNQFLDYLEPSVQDDEAVFFEHPIGPNRSDVNRFNGQSYTYELKSPRDSLKRIGGQLDAYQRVFEYVYLVIPEEVTEPSGVDKSVGLIRYTHAPFEFHEARESSKQADLDPEFQLNQLQLADLEELANIDKLEESDRQSKRAILVNTILAQKSHSEINHDFKEMLKRRHLGRHSQ